MASSNRQVLSSEQLSVTTGVLIEEKESVTERLRNPGLKHLKDDEHQPLLPSNLQESIDNYHKTREHFAAVLAYFDSIYPNNPDELKLEKPPLAAFDSELIREARKRSTPPSAAISKNIDDDELVSIVTLNPHPLRRIHDAEQYFSNHTDMKKRLLYLSKTLVSSTQRALQDAKSELNLSNKTSVDNCKRKIDTLTDNLLTMGMYVEQMMYNLATETNHREVRKYIEKQENPTMKTVMRALLGAAVVTAGVAMIAGSTLLAMALAKSIVAAPLALKLAKISIPLGIKTIKTGLAITAGTAGLTGLGVTYGGVRMFANAVRPSTPKDIMELIHEERTFVSHTPESELKDMAAAPSMQNR